MTMAALRDHHGCGGEIEALSSLLRRQQELVTQLRALVLPSLVNGSGGSSTAELAVQLFDDVIGCNTSVVARLRLSSAGSGGLAAVDKLVDDKSLVRKKIGGTPAASENLEEKPIRKRRRRNGGKQSRTLVTNVPDYDGHQWRKYGQKNINGTQHVRSYYRCTYRSERNCLANKTVQEQDQKGSSTACCGDEAAKYTVVYYGHHTCKGDGGSSSSGSVHLPQLVTMDLEHVQSGGGGGEELAPRTGQVFEDCDIDLDLAALLEVLDDSLLDW